MYKQWTRLGSPLIRFMENTVLSLPVPRCFTVAWQPVFFAAGGKAGASLLNAP